MPGGWCDVNCSVAENTIKEVKEEAGIDVYTKKLIAVLDRNKHNKPIYAYGVVKIFVLCENLGGEFVNNIETVESRYFAKEEIPDNLAEEKVNRQQILMCFEANETAHWTTKFD